MNEGHEIMIKFYKKSSQTINMNDKRIIAKCMN